MSYCDKVTTKIEILDRNKILTTQVIYS